MAVATTERIRTFDDFVEVHGLLLAASGIPESLRRRLFEKLLSETFDGGDFFQVEPVDELNGSLRRLVLTVEFLGKESDVFLVDHAWSFRLPDVYKQLKEIPGLAKRMASLMCVDIDLIEEQEAENNEVAKLSVAEVVEKQVCEAKDKYENDIRWLEIDNLDMDDALFLSLDLPNRFPNLIVLSLCGNKLEDAEAVLHELIKFRHLRALWLYNNPVLHKCDDQMAGTILQCCPKLEIYNSCFTCNFGKWALGFCGGLYNKDCPVSNCEDDNALWNVTQLDVSHRCIKNIIVKAFSHIEMPFLSHLNLRGNPMDENSADSILRILKGFTSLHALEVDIPGPLGDSAIDILEALPSLSMLNGVSASKVFQSEKTVIDSMLQPLLPELVDGESLIDRIINATWFYLMTYRLADEEKIDETCVWYVMDELGSALRHSDLPNFRVSPFLFMPDGKLSSGVSFSILWPTENVQQGEECTRDFLFGIGEEKQRSARLTAWFQTPENYFVKEYNKYWQKLQSTKLASLPLKSSASSSLLRGAGSPLRVYTDIPQVEEYLTRSEFVLTSEPKDADIIWTSMQVDEETRKTLGLNDSQYINQFPFEACLVMKHHLAETVQKAHGAPDWLQPTYNLETQLTQLIGDYYVRKRDGLDNLWILKPWNMARTIDTTVTGNLSAVIRLMETGPKICQKYIEHPALFREKKFDLRYVVLVRSIDPLEIFLTDVFWVRLANNPYTLEKQSLFEYETHFTVMNYRGPLNNLSIAEFVREFEKEHQVNWVDIHSRVKKMIRSVFESTAVLHPEMQSPKSRSMYGVDVMLDSDFQPKLLEVTYCPDCTRACKYDSQAVLKRGETVKGSDFFNYVFGCLFLNETNHVSLL